MPPIFGILNTLLKPVDPEMIRRMKDAAVYLKPREIFSRELPGAFLAAAVVKDNPLVPGKDTLVIDGNWVLVADVSLYKKDEGRGTGDKEQEECECRGRRSDSEYIMETWLKWGRDCVKHLYGDFAFVIFNTQTGEIFCGRDHLGVRPLFYTFQNDRFIFASELRLVAAALPEKPAIRQDYLLDTLITAKTAKHLAPFENCYRLKPAHAIHISKNSINESEYWQADTEKKIRLQAEQEYISLLRDQLTSAVTMRCRGVSLLGTELSGGLDSSAITGIAAQYMIQHDKKLSAYSNLFPEESNIEFKDEREFIAAMREFIPFDWHGIDRLSEDLAETLKFAVNIQGVYIQQNFSIFGKALYEEAGDKNIQVLLSGFGGDELVSAPIAMPWNELIRARKWKIISDEIFHQGITIKSILKPFLIAARFLKASLFPVKYTSGVFTKELLDKRFANLPLQPDFASKHMLRKRLGNNYRRLRHKKSSQRQFDRITMDHVPQRMEYCYAAAAQYGMEYRYPLWDKDLVETALAFPPWMKQHHGINRYQFRQIIQGFVPGKIKERDDKSGATIPHIFNSMATDKEPLLAIINRVAGTSSLDHIFDMSRFPEWYKKLAMRDPKEINYLNPGAFYGYLMMMIYEDKEDRRS
jgi:asparagine synthase (glutamine-hydrolysing)